MEKVLGRAEHIDLPDLGLHNVPAKVDTGAYSSSLDCSHVEVVQHDGRQQLAFVLLRPGREGYSGKTQYSADFTVTNVTNANGSQDRYVLFADMIIHGQRARCRFTLTDRSALRYPALIGRRFIREAGYVVDVSQGQGLPDDEEERGL